MNKIKMKRCPVCNDAWIYASIGDYGSGYDNYGYKVNCKCGGSFLLTDWQPTREKAIEEWNKLFN